MSKEEYLYTCVSEESADLVKQCSKIIKFGLLSTPPNSTLNNKEILIKNVNDLVAVIELALNDNIDNIIDNVTVLTKMENTINIIS